MSLRLIGYVRVSAPCQVRGTSFETQAAAIRAVCDRSGYEIVALRQEQQTASGCRHRSVFQRTLFDISADRADGLIVYSLDRFARSALQGLTTAQWLHDRHKELVVVDLSLDTTTPFGQCMLTILLAFAELERNLILTRTAAGLNQVRERNGYHGGRPGYGFTTATIQGRKGVLPKRSEEFVIERIHQLRQSGLSYNAIARQLEADRIPTKDKRHWHAGTIWNIYNQTHSALASWAPTQPGYTDALQEINPKPARDGK